jgi:hypothetical protein
MPIQGYTPNRSLAKIAQNSTDNWDVWLNQNLDTLDEPVLVYNVAAAESLSAGSVAIIKDDGTGAKKAYLATGAAYAFGDPLGVALASAQAGASVSVALEGRVQNGAWSFGPADKFVYLSNSGTVTSTTTSVKLGYVLSSTAIYFIPPTVSGGQTDTVAGSNGLQNTGGNVNAVIAPVYGSSANTVCQGNDTRLHGQNTDQGTSAESFEINYAGNSARLLTTGLTANRDYTLPDGATKLVGESVPSAITAQHSFSPASAQAPFALGANAQGQLVTGLNADKLDGNEATAFATSGHNHDASYAPIAKGVTGGDAHDHSGGDGAAIPLTSAVTGALPIANGGSGQTTANAALNALLPAQSGNKGKALISDGASSSWMPLPRRNFVVNGDGKVAQRAAGTDVIKNASAGVYVFGSCDRFTGAWTGSTCAAGSLLQVATAGGRTGFAHQFLGVTLTGTGVLKHRTRIASINAKVFKNQIASFQVKVLHDVGSSVNFTLYIRKANSADNFSSVTEISNSGAIAVASSTSTTLSMENVSMGDCSNGIELEVVAGVGAITNKNMWMTEYQLEVGAGITDFEYESFSETLAKCQWSHKEIVLPNGGAMLGGGYIQNTNIARFTAPCAPMRSAPTLTYSGPLEIIYATGSTYAVTGVTDVRHAGAFTSFYMYGATSPLTAGQSCALYANGAEARIKLDCEL